MAICVLPFTVLHADDYDDLIAAAVGNPNRLEASVVRDPLRKPAEIIKFMGIEPGMTVLDVIAITGYYTEILAGVVGDEGRVISHAFAAQGMDPDNPFAAHIRNSEHLSNVVPIYADFADLELKENTLDAVFLIQNFHDLYFERFNIDVDAKLAMFRKALKPGGILAIIDHAAVDDAPSTSGNSLHRISPVLARQVLKDAGFILQAQSDILLNDTDDLSKMVFVPEVRGKTSRFVLRYSNP